MKIKTIMLGGAAFAMSATAALAEDMTIVSWGGAYTASQQAAYHDPYSAKTGVNIINDASSGEAVAKLRAMSEAGNITWDVVDVVAADALRLCDEGLALEIDADTQLDAAGVTALETDPEVGTNTLNYLSKWDGSALVTGSIFDNGNVGIGTTSPEGKLTVLGGDIVVREDDNENDAIKLWAGNVEAVISAYKAGIESIRLDSGNGDSWIDNGNVGIGTTSPNFQLSLGAGLSHTKIALYETGATNHYGMGIVAGQFSFHLNGSGARYAFYDSDDLTNELLTIKGSGNVGIGTTSPSEKLTVVGTIESTSGGIKFPDGTTQTTAAIDAYDHPWLSDGTEFAYYNGNVGIGTGTTRPSAKLEIGGTAGVDGIMFPDGTLQTTAATPGGGDHEHGSCYWTGFKCFYVTCNKGYYQAGIYVGWANQCPEGGGNGPNYNLYCCK